MTVLMNEGGWLSKIMGNSEFSANRCLCTVVSATPWACPESCLNEADVKYRRYCL